MLLFGQLASSSVEARPTAVLSYAPPADDVSCPDAASLKRMVAAQLGFDPFVSEAPLRVHVTLERAASGHRARVAFVTGSTTSGERALDGRDCASVANAVALTVAVALDTLNDGEREAAAPAAPAASASASASVEPVAPPPQAREARSPEAPPPPSRPLALRASIAPKVSVGAAPGTAFGAAGAVGVRGSLLSLSLEARGDLPSFAPLSIGGELGTSLVLAGLVPCAHYRRWALCAMASVGSMRGESRGVARPASDEGFYGNAGLRLALDLPLSRRLALRPELDGLVVWARPKLHFNDNAVWNAPSISGVFGLALVVQLGEGGF